MNRVLLWLFLSNIVIIKHVSQALLEYLKWYLCLIETNMWSVSCGLISNNYATFIYFVIRSRIFLCIFHRKDSSNSYCEVKRILRFSNHEKSPKINFYIHHLFDWYVFKLAMLWLNHSLISLFSWVWVTIQQNKGSHFHSTIKIFLKSFHSSAWLSLTSSLRYIVTFGRDSLSPWKQRAHKDIRCHVLPMDRSE